MNFLSSFPYHICLFLSISVCFYIVTGQANTCHKCCLQTDWLWTPALCKNFLLLKRLNKEAWEHKMLFVMMGPQDKTLSFIFFDSVASVICWKPQSLKALLSTAAIASFKVKLLWSYCLHWKKGRWWGSPALKKIHVTVILLSPYQH